MGQYFENELLKSNLKIHDVDILEHKFKFYTDNGVFSKKGLDYGSRFLLESIDMSSLGSSLLDVGCGYGPLSIIASRATNLKRVLGIDVNERAVHLANKNSKLNKIDNTEFIVSDIYEKVDEKFDTIITNPPIRAGKEVVYKIFFEAKKYLNKKGSLYIVIRKEQGAESAIRDLKKEYNVELVNKSKGFFVIKCKIYKLKK